MDAGRIGRRVARTAAPRIGALLLCLGLLAVLAAPRPAAAGDCTLTPSNPEGPFHLPDAPLVTALDRDDEPGERIELAGRVFDYPDCEPVAGAVLDLWQANAEGFYYNLETAAAPGDYRLRGRVRTDAEGRFRVRTVRPGAYRTGPRSWRPAHIHAIVSGPGVAPLTTQVYLPGDPHQEADALFLPALEGAVYPRPDGTPALYFDFVLTSR